MNFTQALLKRIKADNLKEFTEKQIYAMFNLRSAFERKQIRKALEELESQGRIYFDGKKRKYVTTDSTSLIKGVVSGNKRGFAFILCEDKNLPDLFVSHRNLRGAMHGDTVLCRLIGGSGGESGDEAEVVSILERGITEVVGTYISSHGYGFVEPDDTRYYADIYIKNGGGARNGDKVVAKITDFPARKNPEGKITEILGKSNNPATDILAIIRSYNLYEKFPENAAKEAKKAAGTPFDASGRKDLRELLTFTIDGDDAKDLDDAVSISKEGDVYVLGVHIADVGHYVAQNSPLDKEALKRGTSVYFPGSVLPMLPAELSNGVCSLNPQQDRLALSVIMRVNAQGKVTKYEIAQSVIRSKARLTYDEVEKILSGDKELYQKYIDFVDTLRIMQELTNILISKRGRRGSIDFDLPEAKIILGGDGSVEEIKPYPRGISNRIIEEFMILTNETVANFCREKELPVIYRIHEEPSQEKMEAFNRFMGSFGYNFSDEEKPTPLQFAKLLEEIEGKPEYPLINKVMLRAMMKAKYSTENAGHFGLASKCYCHFTSPIRRYPDLFVHRSIKAHLNGEDTKDLFAKAQTVSLQSSEREKLAEEAEREVDDYYKAKYMEKFIGSTFDGIISGVTEFGIFVELNNTVEGMIRIENLKGDGYRYYKDLYMLKNNSNTYKLGGEIKVMVEWADARSRRIDFLPV